MKRIATLLLMTLPLCAQDYKIAIIGMVHSHDWGHFKPMLARKHDIKVLVNYQMAWWPANYTAKAQADSGALGQVWRLRGIVGHGGPGSTGTGKYFFDWLTDPVKNGAGALMDFGCYNALWSLWYLGRPETVFAEVLHLRPERFPKVEDNATIVLQYPKAVGIYEGSWDLPRSYQDL